MKLTEFETAHGKGAVHEDIDDGDIRLELPGHWMIQSVFPGSGGKDMMNVTLVPVAPVEVDNAG